MHQDIQKRLLGRFFVSLFLFFLLLLPLGCGDQQRSSISSEGAEATSVSDSKTSSATLMIRWNKVSKSRDSLPLRAEDCQEDDIENVICEVYDASDSWLASGGPWSYSDHSGRVSNIPIGENRTFVALAEDGDGNIICQGETTGITINPDEIEAVAINAASFLPTLTAPDHDDQQVDPTSCSLEWESVPNASEYIVQVAEDSNFQTIAINASTVDTSYTPADLQPLTEYFWKVSAKDLYGNIGAESETRSFITTSGEDDDDGNDGEEEEEEEEEDENENEDEDEEDVISSFSGTVVDASTAEPISGAAISVDEGAYTTSTNAAGQYSFENVVIGSYAVTASADGYTSSTQSVTLEEGTSSTVDFVLSEIIVNFDEYRIVLTWDIAPRDLDSHIWTPDGSHVYFVSMGSELTAPYTQLDTDDTSSYGPETITIYQAQPGTYTYSVYNYSGELNISESGATVEVYGESGLIQEWNVPDGDGRWWNVFTLDGSTGQINVINSISDAAQ